MCQPWSSDGESGGSQPERKTVGSQSFSIECLPGKSSFSSSDLPPPLERGERAFTLFQKVQGALGHIPNLAETFNAILDAVIDGMDAENCSLMLKDSISGELSIRAARGKNDGKSAYYADHPRNGKRFKSGEGIAGWVFKEGQAVMLSDTREEPRFIRAAELKDNVGSLMCFPVRENNHVLGVFNLNH